LAVIFKAGRTEIELYDVNGNLVKQGLLPSMPYGMPCGSFEDVLIGSLEFTEGMPDLLAMLPKEDHDKLLAAGLDPDHFSDDNPYLVVGRFVTK